MLNEGNKMLISSFSQARQYLQKDLLFVCIIFFINTSLLYLFELCDSSSFKESSELTILYSFSLGLAQAWTLISLAVRIQSHVQTKKSENIYISFLNGFYATPASLLYSIIYLFMTLFGCFLFLLPGLYAGVFLFYAPFLAMFNIEGDDGYLKESSKLVKGNIPHTILFLILCFLAESLTYGVSYLLENQVINYTSSWLLNLLSIAISIIIQSWFCHFFFRMFNKKTLG